MAEVNVDVYKMSFNGLDMSADYLTDSTLNGSDDFLFNNNGKTFLHVMNGDSSQHTVTIKTPRKVAGLDVAEVSVDVPAGENRFIGPFQPGVFNSGGETSFSLDAGTSMEIGVISI